MWRDTDRLKVAYVTFAPFVSGAERSLQAILTFAPAVGIEPVVLCPKRSALIPWCEANGVRYLTAPLADRDKWHPFKWFHSVFAVARLLKRERIDVIHSNQVWCYAAAGTAAGWLGIPRVVHVRDELSVTATRWWCRSGVEAVICISKFIREGVAPAWADDERAIKIRTLTNPVMITATDAVETRVREQLPGVVRQFRDRFKIQPAATTFGYIGQVIEVKGVLELLRALSKLTPHPSWHLLIAGRDPRPGQPYELACKQAVADLGLTDRVTFVGFLEDVGTFYSAIDCAVVPSLEEPLGRIPFEAAAYAKPSIAFATGGLKETIVEGETGWLVPTGDVEGLRDALAAFIALPAEVRASSGEAARLRVQRVCDPVAHVAELARIYAELRGNGRGNGSRG